MRLSPFSFVNTLRWRGVVVALALAIPLVVHEPARSQGATPSGLVQSGVDAYMKSGPGAAFAAWSKGGAAEGNNQLRLKFDALKQIDAAYGRIEGSDVILNLNVGSRVRMIYFVLYYAKGTAYGYLEAYRLGPGGWVMADMDINTRPQEIIPAPLLTRLPLAQ